MRGYVIAAVILVPTAFSSTASAQNRILPALVAPRPVIAPAPPPRVVAPVVAPVTAPRVQVNNPAVSPRIDRVTPVPTDVSNLRPERRTKPTKQKSGSAQAARQNSGQRSTISGSTSSSQKARGGTANAGSRMVSASKSAPSKNTVNNAGTYPNGTIIIDRGGVWEVQIPVGGGDYRSTTVPKGGDLSPYTGQQQAAAGAGAGPAMPPQGGGSQNPSSGMMPPFGQSGGGQGQGGTGQMGSNPSGGGDRGGGNHPGGNQSPTGPSSPAVPASSNPLSSMSGCGTTSTCYGTLEGVEPESDASLKRKLESAAGAGMRLVPQAPSAEPGMDLMRSERNDGAPMGR